MAEMLPEEALAHAADAESLRLAALRRYGVLDTQPEDIFDRLTRLAADRFRVPIAVISLVDAHRQWFKSRVGIDLTETSREDAFSSRAIEHGDVCVVPDALEDSRFAGNPFVVGEPHVRFYAGAPLTTPDGFRIGTLCIIDRLARPDLTADERKLLEHMADLVVRELELRREIQARAEAQAKLVESEARFRGSFETAPYGMALVSPTGRLIKVNRALCDFLGYPEGELLATDFQALTYPPDLHVDLVHVEALLSGLVSTYSMEKRYLRKNGETAWAHLSVSLVRDSNGAPLHFVSQVQNIQERKNQETRIAELLERNRLATEAGQLGIWEWNIETGVAIWDPGMHRLYKFDGPAVPLTDAAWSSFLHPDDSGFVAEHIQEALAGSADFDTEFRIVWPSGETRYIRAKATIMRNDRGAPVKMVGVNWDVTEIRSLANRLAAEKQALEDANREIVRQSQELRTMAEATAYGLLAVDGGGRIIHANSVIQQLFQYSSEELIGHSIGMLIPDASDASVRYATAWTRDVFGLDRFGHRIPLDIQLRNSESRDGPIIVATVFDLRPRIAVEEGLKRAKEEAERANRAKSEFLTVMSHELRTPMNAVLGFGQLLQKQSYGPLNARQHEYVEAILDSGSHLLELINDILELSKIEAGKMTIFSESVELLPVCKSVLVSLAQFAERYGIVLDFGSFGAGLPPVMADRTRLAQCLYNLGSNAIKYNRRDGTVTFSYELIDEDTIRIAVADTGFGIPEERQSELFQPFNRLGVEWKAIEGTGVGLALTQRLARLMGGSVGFTSAEGKGSTFWIELPRHRALAEQRCG